ncbi:MAG: apolipoprotein N-acyltransferase [Xanthobacteraceae bacterium]
MIAARIAAPVVLAWGWRRALIAFLAGGASTLAMPPLDFWPALFLTFPVIVWLIDGVGIGRWNGAGAAALAGWCFGFGYFLSGLYWVGNAFLVDADIFGYLLPFAVTILPAGLALFTAFGFALARLLWTRGPLRILTLAAALTLAEWLRGHLLTGFPWNAFGYALTGSLALAQAAALIGLWGLTFIAIAVFASPAVLADDKADTPRPWLPPAAAVMLLAALAIYGAIRLAATPTTFVAGVKLRIMQPNIPQDQRFNYAAKAEVMRRYVALSSHAASPQGQGIAGVTHLIWPESAFPFFLTREADALAAIADLLPPGAVLITGGARLAEQESRPGSIRAYNSVYVIDHDGTILSVYDKVHLVPFGEFLPLRHLFERLGLQQLIRVPGGFLPGRRRRVMVAANAPPFVPLVCYEAIFPHAVVPRGEQPGWLLNLTNDGWFGLSSGPYQHLQQARLRAIEEGLPLVRAANTGISAVIDPVGRIVTLLPLGREGVLDSALPQRIASPLYARTGDRISIACVGIILLFSLWRQRAGRPDLPPSG